MKIKKLSNLISAGLFLVALVLWFSVKAITTDVGLGLTSSYSFIDLTFGKSQTVLGVSVELFKFSVLNALGLLFIVLGLLITSYNLISTRKIKSDKTGYSILVFGLLALIVIFLTKNFAVIPDVEFGEVGEALSQYNYTIGAILTAIFAGGAGIIGGLNSILK